jgi:cell division protease FtsH
VPLQRTDTRTGARRPRSFGSFLLVVLVLLVLFWVLGKGPFGAEEEKSQDEFLYLLYTGDLEKVRIKGDRWVLANVRSRRDDAPQTIKASFSDLGKFEDRIRTLAAKDPQGHVFRQDDFLRRLRSKEIALERAYPIRYRTGGEGAQVDEIERFFVDLVVPSEGLVYAEVWDPSTSGSKFSIDLHELLGAAKEAGVPVEEGLVFDGREGQGLRYSAENPLFLYLLTTIAPWIFIPLLIYFFVVRQMRAPGGGGGVLSFGRSRATLYTKENRTNVTFEDVAGIEEAKEEVREIIEFLKNPARFQRLGGRIPRGVLLVGPPGTGKTLLAKAIAGEAEVPFFSISGSDFVEMFVGVGASRVRDLFKQAKENSPCIVFLDEIDAVGRKRGTGIGGGHDEREQTLNAILVEMDGFDTDEGVIVVAASNRPDVLDPALLRPGRFDREIVVSLPDVKGRAEILKVHARRVPMGKDVDFGILARSTPTFSGADLAAVINEGAILAALKRKDRVEMEDLEEARERVRFGRAKKSRVMDPEDRAITAHHEAGHALVAALLPEAERPHKVTIIPRGMALGLTMKLPEKDRYTLTRKRILADICVAYGGRIAESLTCDDISSGAHDDIRRATELARLMVCEWGMTDSVGPIHYGERTGSDFFGQEYAFGRQYSEAQAEAIDREVRAVLDRCYHRTEEVIRTHRPELDRIAQALLRFETLTGAEVAALIEGKSVEELRPAAAKPAAAAPKASASPLPEEGTLPDEAPGLAPA